MQRSRARGLSLVELLVTLVLVALTVSLVVGGIGQGSALLARVSADQGTVYEELMARAWLRQTLAAAVSPVAGETGLVGTAQEVRLQSFRPLLGSEGVPTAIAWQAATRGGGLVYVEGQQQVLIESLPAVAGIEYQDAALQWHEQWPVDDKPGLPSRVRVLFADGGDSVDVALLTRQAVVLDAEDAEYDSE